VDFSLQNNFNLKAARHQEEAARQNAMANKLEHAPKVSGGYEYQNFDTSGSLDIKPDTGFNTSPDGNLEENVLQLRVDLPLYSGGAISAKRRQTAQEYNAARENLINLTRNTVTATRSLHMTVISDVSRVEARKQSIISSQSAVDATQAGYEVGTRNVVDVLNAQNTLFIAERDYFNSRYDYIVNMLRLKEQAGTLSPEDIYNFDAFLVPPPPPTAPPATR
jgi:outer membrane protein